MDRRRFLGGLAAVTVVSACSGSDDDASGDGTTSTTAGPVRAAEPAPATLPAEVFALGVASGDPLADRVILWTRLATAPAVDVPSESPDGEVEVAFDVATDEAFEDLVASDVAVARPALAHSVHVDVTGLQPDTWYFYRFRAGDQTSPVGRTRTFPAEDSQPERFRFVFASCQDYQWGHYAAWGRATEQEDVDAVVFLGDYIYESTFGDLSPTRTGERVWATPEATTLEHYRTRYAQVRSDPQLRAAHHMAPWIVTFDDHEVSNNYAGDVGQADIDQPRSAERRLAGYQAWYEHMPIRLDPPDDFGELEVHRGFAFGSLASLFAIETRQRADVPACRTDGTLVSDDGPLCEDTEDEARTNLGEVQETWLHEALASSSTTWNILANPLMLAGLNTGTVETPSYSRDAWVGYPAARRRLLQTITDNEVSNPVAVTGDWHASFVLDVKPDDDPEAETVLPEFLASSISTVLFADDYSKANPHMRYFVGEHGYGLVTVTPEDLRCEFHYIEDEWDPDSPLSHVDTWVVRDGEREAQPL